MFFKLLKEALKIKQVRSKILFTIFIVLVFRIGTTMTVPGGNAKSLEALNGLSFLNMLSLVSGNALRNFSVFALGVSPYITASIVVQLLQMDILPKFVEWGKQGEVGRRKLNQATRYIALVLAFVQSIGITAGFHTLSSAKLVATPNWQTYLLIGFLLTTGSMIVTWLGEQITDKGYGNGVSMIIFAGIVSRIPSAAYGIYNQFLGAGVNAKGLIFVVAIIVVAIAAITFVVFFSEAERRIPVQYAKRVVGRKMYGGQSTNIPIKVAAGGVMPIIFASSIMAFPATIVRLVSGGNMPTAGLGYYILGCLSAGYASAWWTSLVYAILYALLILFFTYFYSSIQFNPIELANNMKKSGGYIPGIRPGKPTSDYIGKISSRLNLVGAFFLAIIAILPVIVGAIFNVTALQIGGTSLLIMEGVALETVRQIESQMTMRHYKGFLE